MARKIYGNSAFVFSEESLSIDETNKLRASLGLAPLEVEEAGPKEGQLEGGDGSAKIYKEDGMEFVHKKAEHLGEKKRAEEMREKLQVSVASTLHVARNEQLILHRVLWLCLCVHRSRLRSKSFRRCATNADYTTRC